MTACFIDTTISVEVAASSPRAEVCEKVILSNVPGEIPYYALREFLTGWVRALCELHNILSAAPNIGEALTTLVAHSQFRGRSGNFKLQEYGEVLAKIFSSVAGTPGDQAKSEAVEILALKIARAWGRARRKQPWTFVQPLGCFNKGDLTFGKAGELRGPNDSFNCRSEERCGAAGYVFEEEIALSKMIDALHPSNLKEAAAGKQENKSRRKALKELRKDGAIRFDKGRCRAIGDAYFAAMCPRGSLLLTTNVSDFEPLCAALGKKFLDPTK